MSNPITDVLWWINSEVDQLSGTALASVTDVLGTAQAELSRDLSKAITGGLEDRYTAQMHRNALVQINGALTHIRKKTGPGVANALQQGGEEATALAAAHLAHEVAAFSSIFEGSVRPISLDTSAMIAKGDNLLWPRFKNAAARYAGQVGIDIRRQLAVGLIKGETIDQLTKRLASLGGPKGLVYTRGQAGDPNSRAEIISEGLFRRYGHWGERLARTEVVHAYNASALIGMDELERSDPGYYKRWDAAIDGRLCPICRDMDDRVTTINGVFPGGYPHPPRHPCCRCACVVWRKEWDEADVKDDLTGQVTKGKTPGVISTVPHRIEVKDELKPESKPKPVSPKIENFSPKVDSPKHIAKQVKQVQASKAELATKQANQAALELKRIEKEALKASNALAKQERELKKAERLAEAKAKLEAKQAKAREALEARKAAKALATVKTGKDDQDSLNRKAVEKMKKSPMAKKIHERVSIEGIDKKSIAEFEKEISSRLGRKVTFAEITHGFAPPPGFYSVVDKVESDYVYFKIYDEKTNAFAATLHRSFPKKGEIYHSLFVVEKPYQSAKLSDTINGQAMLRYEKWGVKQATVGAAWVGRYAWARLGFNFDYPEQMHQNFKKFIATRITDSVKREMLIQQSELLCKEPWKLAKWDIGQNFKETFYSGDDHQTGEFSIGKAFLLHSGYGSWDGTMAIKASNPGYLNALRLLNVASRQ